MDVKAVTDNFIDAAFLAFVAALVSTFALWIKEALAKWRAYYEWRRNPHARVGARLHEWRDAANRPVFGAARIIEARRGRVVLRRIPPTCAEASLQDRMELVLTIREFQAGHAFWGCDGHVAA